MLMPLGVFQPADLLLSRECCQAGDLLEVDRKLYAHWVVYVGNNEVVHVPETGKNRAVVEKCSLESVAQDCLVRVNNKQVPAKGRGLTELPRDHVLTQALSCVGSTVRYNFVVSNSEHFVTWLKYGVGWSDQAKAMRHSLSSLSPSPSPRQVEKAHHHIWSEIHNILTSSPSPPSPSPSPSPSSSPFSASLSSSLSASLSSFNRSSSFSSSSSSSRSPSSTFSSPSSSPPSSLSPSPSSSP